MTLGNCGLVRYVGGLEWARQEQSQAKQGPILLPKFEWGAYRERGR